MNFTIFPEIICMTKIIKLISIYPKIRDRETINPTSKIKHILSINNRAVGMLE